MSGARGERPDGNRPAADSRHRGREAAVQMLYQWEVGHADPADVVESFWTIEQPADPPGDRSQRFAGELVRGTIARLDEIDELIAGSAEHWRPARMGTIDRLIIRLAVFELLIGDTPAPVVIDEALNLARTFSTEEAVRFVNGMLDGIRRRLAPEPTAS